MSRYKELLRQRKWQAKVDSPGGEAVLLARADWKIEQLQAERDALREQLAAAQAEAVALREALGRYAYPTCGDYPPGDCCRLIGGDDCC